MVLNILLFLAAAIAGFFIAYQSGNKSKAILIPAVIAGIIAILPVLTDPKSLGFLGPVGLIVFVALASMLPAAGSALGCGLGFVFYNLKKQTLTGNADETSKITFNSYILKLKEIYLTPKNVKALVISIIGILLMTIAYFATVTTRGNESDIFKLAILLLNPVGLIIFLFGINRLLKK